MTKTYKEAYQLMEKLASNHHQMVYDRIARNPMLEALQIDVINVLYAQLLALSKKMESL